MIYLDSAATSLLKPVSVSRAVLRAMRECASPGRGSHRAAEKAAELAFDCREAAAALFRADSPEQVVFTMNATHALNIALSSLVNRGDRVVISGYEHNAVVRPLYALGADVSVAASPLFDRNAALEAFAERIQGARAVVCTHVSNVFGFVLPVEEIAGLCRGEGVPFVLDASQSAGILDVDMKALSAAFIALPGHKGLMGPQGTGILLCGAETKPLLYGGTGSASRDRNMPAFLPDRLEAGTQNICGIAGLREGLRFVSAVGTNAIRKKEKTLAELFCRGLEGSGAAVFRTDDPAVQCGVVSVIPPEGDCEEAAERLGKRGVAVRAGLHCAPLAHETAGTADKGTVRFSFSPLLTPAEIRNAAKITKEIFLNSNRM